MQPINSLSNSAKAFLENIKFSTYATNSIWNRIKNLFKYEYTQKRAAEKNAISTETVIIQGKNHSLTLGETIEDEFGNIERIIIKKDICEKLKLATRDIKDMYKDVLELYFFEGKKYRKDTIYPPLRGNKKTLS